jgi:L-seryl-tRNA(Ser) seleniumtransferase
VSSSAQDLLRRIPKVDEFLSSAPLLPLLEQHPRPVVLEEVRTLLDGIRQRGVAGQLTAAELETGALAGCLAAALHRRARPYYRRVINGTGVILHTGLGRAPLAPEVARVLAEMAPVSQRVEIDLETGERGGRDRGCGLLLEQLLGCEAATVVNNNAAATLVILAALARGKGVLLSRGEMVEIGGSYRVPEIMEESGARLVGVGTTNRTHPRDYEGALDESVGMILKVHTSNYRVVGFTREVGVEELVALGRKHGVPVVHDLGSGCLLDLARHGRPGEEWVRRSIDAGVDLVCFSGDKLLGGPQAGIIAGKAAAVERCRRHPLFRSLRPGRLVYTALEATLRLYQDEEGKVLERIPALRRLTEDAGALHRRARRWARRWKDLPGLDVRAVECTSQAGSGSLPARDIPSAGLRLVPVPGDPGGPGDLGDLGSVDALAAALRRGEPAILARVQDEALLLDLRTLDEDEMRAIGARLRELTEGGGAQSLDASR